MDRPRSPSPTAFDWVAPGRAYALRQSPCGVRHLGHRSGSYGPLTAMRQCGQANGGSPAARCATSAVPPTRALPFASSAEWRTPVSVAWTRLTEAELYIPLRRRRHHNRAWRRGWWGSDDPWLNFCGGVDLWEAHADRVRQEHVRGRPTR